jgi:hypothetical protein
MTMTIMYLTVAFLLAALAVSAYVRVRGLEFAYGNPLANAAILLVVALFVDLIGQLTLSTQGWLLTSGTKALWLWKVALALQGVAVIIFILGIWWLFAAIGQILLPGRRARTPASAAASAPADADTTD